MKWCAVVGAARVGNAVLVLFDAIEVIGIDVADGGDVWRKSDVKSFKVIGIVLWYKYAPTVSMEETFMRSWTASWNTDAKVSELTVGLKVCRSRSMSSLPQTHTRDLSLSSRPSW